ncbi:hypothetical protein BC829DRAFT_421793 [Chytridium lagenaria]|nr:hypothetical protein BC829DRAFT_421793 [Chytridium lagenaria]
MNKSRLRMHNQWQIHSKAIARSGTLEGYIVTFNPPSFPCPNCNSIFNTEKALNRHIKNNCKKSKIQISLRHDRAEGHRDLEIGSHEQSECERRPGVSDERSEESCFSDGSGCDGVGIEVAGVRNDGVAVKKEGIGRPDKVGDMLESNDDGISIVESLHQEQSDEDSACGAENDDESYEFDDEEDDWVFDDEEEEDRAYGEDKEEYGASVEDEEKNGDFDDEIGRASLGSTTVCVLNMLKYKRKESNKVKYTASKCSRSRQVKPTLFVLVV